MQPRAGARGTATQHVTRPVYFGRHAGTVNTPIFNFDTLAPGWQVEGPAITEQQFSTIFVLPRHCARIDDFGSVLMEVRQ